MIQFDSENYYWKPQNAIIKDVHTEHCCILHGCKYGEDCAVWLGYLEQSFPCESCYGESYMPYIPKASIQEIEERREKAKEIYFTDENT